MLAGALLALAAWTGVAMTPGSTGILLAAVVLTVLAVFVLYFFRDPTHHPPEDPALVLAPGQGRVLGVDEAEEPTFVGGACRRISIFLSIFDVHVQRAPVSGVVEYRHYRPGKYAMAWRDKASEDNEQASLGISTPHGKVLVRQIAGLVARRIVTDPSEGERVERGERIGLIRFGSRVEIFLPLSWEVTCAAGDRAVAGSTVLARQPAYVSG